jgi:hypothetical protein
MFLHKQTLQLVKSYFLMTKHFVELSLNNKIQMCFPLMVWGFVCLFIIYMCRPLKKVQELIKTEVNK